MLQLYIDKTKLLKMLIFVVHIKILVCGCVGLFRSTGRHFVLGVAVYRINCMFVPHSMLCVHVIRHSPWARDTIPLSDITIIPGCH